LDIAIRAWQIIIRQHPAAEFHIYGDGNMKEEWTALARQLGLENHVRFFEPLPIHQIADRVANADLGLVPKRADSFGNEAYSTKIMEFMSQGIPVVGSRTRIDAYYFNEAQIAFFESGNHQDMAAKILNVLADRDYAARLAAAGRAYVAEHNWASKRQDYFDIVDDVTSAAPDPNAVNAPERQEFEAVGA
jgi:glycosyltransferase involved in cell wall biosynthesis